VTTCIRRESEKKILIVAFLFEKVMIRIFC
jgi:hypothetical protein